MLVEVGRGCRPKADVHVQAESRDLKIQNLSVRTSRMTPF